MDSILRHPFFPLVSMGIILSLLFIFFFPPTFVAIDEHQYLKNAFLIQNSQLKSADPLTYCGGAVVGTEYLSNYHIGKSIFLIPFTWLPFPFAMVSGLIIHLISMFIFALILRKLKLNPWLLALFAFYPALLWESRTLFSETLALTFLLGAIYFYLERSSRAMLAAGILFGLAALVRIDTILISIGFAAALIWKEKQTLITWKRSPAISFVIGGIISGTLLLAWNTWYNGSPFLTQLGNPSRLFTTFPQPLFFNNLFLLIVLLMAAYPFMLLALARFKELRLELFLATILTLALFSNNSNISVFNFFSPLTITARMRYLIPLAGILLVAYAAAISPSIEKIKQRIGKTNILRIGVVIGIIFLVGAVALHTTHQDFLMKREAVSTQLQSAIPDGALVIGSSDDCIYFMPALSGDRKYAKVDSANQNISNIFAQNSTVYVMQLSYSNQSDSDERQETIDKERKAIADFIRDNTSSLEEVFQTNTPHYLTIYRLQR